jgi:GMP synthase-like glutamine amidotransferase
MKHLRIHYLQHVPFEGLGYINTWIQENGHSLTSTALYKSTFFPSLNDFDWLIIMGGPMNVNDHKSHPWLASEKEFIKKAINTGKTVIGVCLGAQLIASALGARVYPNTKKEIGWFPVSKTYDGMHQSLLSNIPEVTTVFHWHGDTFDLPYDATHLFQTDICPNQSFLYKKNVLALQFHLEMTPEAIIEISENCRNELFEDEFIQTEQEMIANADYCKGTNKYLKLILDRLAM